MGLMRVVNLAHGAFAAIGGYLAVGLLTPLGMPLGLAILLAVAIVAAFSVAVERLLYVHLYGAPELDQVLLTVGINFIVVAGLTLAFGPNVLPSRLPPSLAASVDLGIRSFETYRLVVLAVGVVVIGGLWLVFERTSFGARLRAAVDNRTMAQAVGIDVPRLFSIAFAMGSALAALGGALGAPLLPLEPLYPFKYLVLVLVIVALSGFGNVRATLFVAIFVGIVDTAARYFLPEIGGLHALCAADRPDRLATGWTARSQERPVTGAVSPFLLRHRLRPLEPVWWLLAIAYFFVFPEYLAVATSVLVMALFALSLDLLIGFAGVLSLGHAVSFGIGAYVCALINLAGWREPITGVLVGGAASGLFALVVGPLILRLKGLPFIMITLGIGAIFYEAANKAVWLTGGDNGLPGVTLDPLLGLFRWSIFGQTSYLYVLCWLLVLFYLARRIVASPFGVALQGIRENPERMRLIGAPVLRHLVMAYTIASAMAGIAGALSAQTNAFVGLEVLSLTTSIDGLVMLVLGGIGRLYGGLIGAPVYMFVQHFAQQWNPYYWMFLIGGLLIFIVRFSRGGLLGLLDSLLRHVGQGRDDR